MPRIEKLKKESDWLSYDEVISLVGGHVLERSAGGNETYFVKIHGRKEVLSIQTGVVWTITTDMDFKIVDYPIKINPIKL